LFSRYWSCTFQIGFIFGKFFALGSNTFSALCFLIMLDLIKTSSLSLVNRRK
jgi:hypothetical protein